MAYTTLDLITRRLYSRAIEEGYAIQELKNRGWNRPFRVLALAIIVPLILPERIFCGLGGDDWDDGPTRWNDILFSIAFSQLILMPPLVLWSTYQWLFSSGALPVGSTIVLGVSYVFFEYVYKHWA